MKEFILFYVIAGLLACVTMGIVVVLGSRLNIQQLNACKTIRYKS